MFDESLVVQSAISAFNNAALALPAFFWLGILMLPMFYVVYKYGNQLMDMVGWERFGLQSRIIKWTIIMSLIWLVLFGGNYVVLRDGASLLPFVTAVIAFMGMLFVGNITRGIKLPKWHDLSRNRKWRVVLFAMLILAIIGLTDTHTWWGPILQIAAFVGGAVVGRRMKKNINVVPFVSGFVFLFTVMILMQPEFFRFGQLGSLTLLHLAGIAFVGLPIIGCVMLRNFKSQAKIYHSAFVKLKWLMRCLVLLSGCLFVMTESVPVFIGTCGLAAALFWLKIIHAKSMPQHLADKLLMLALFSFGVLTIMPVVSCLAIFGWLNLPRGNFIDEVHTLL
ncbi:MAG: hypothetical protein IKP24_01380 [Alphaproteobacteria bacterium]|nr:hypothetical protein [Alphaproteobacteria bacterium]